MILSRLALAQDFHSFPWSKNTWGPGITSECASVWSIDPQFEKEGSGWIPSGKVTWLWKITIFHGKTHYKWPETYNKLWKIPPFFMGKLTISMTIFNSKLLVYQRVNIYKHPTYKSVTRTVSPLKPDIGCRMDPNPNGLWPLWPWDATGSGP